MTALKTLDGESVHVGEDLASFADLSEVAIDIIHGLSVPLNETAEFTSEELRLQTWVRGKAARSAFQTFWAHIGSSERLK